MTTNHIDPRLLRRLIDKSYLSSVAIRREIHAHPELSGQEHETAKRVHTVLCSLGLRPRFCLGKTGVIAEIRNGKGPTIVLRADMDALPIHEENSVPFRSKRPGIMHACGHDMHTAILLGAANVLTKTTDTWHGTIVLLFQPSEEAEPSGARRMIEEGHFPQNADAVIGLHVNPEQSTGQVGLKSGKDYAGILDFDVIVHGRGGHGGKPELARNPIPCCAEMILVLQSLKSRINAPAEPVVITVGQVNAGTARNVIPDQARFSGTMRSFSTAIQQRLVEEMKKRLEAIAKKHDVTVEIRILKSFPSGYNDPALTDLAKAALGRILGKNRVIDRPEPIMYSEDFAYYQQLVPGLYGHLGVRDPRKKITAGPHNASFLPDEKAIKTGITFHTSVALELLFKSK